jgi:hypothetical protein
MIALVWFLAALIVVGGTLMLVFGISWLLSLGTLLR